MKLEPVAGYQLLLNYGVFEAYGDLPGDRRWEFAGQQTAYSIVVNFEWLDLGPDSGDGR